MGFGFRVVGFLTDGGNLAPLRTSPSYSDLKSMGHSS